MRHLHLLLLFLFSLVLSILLHLPWSWWSYIWYPATHVPSCPSFLGVCGVSGWRCWQLTTSCQRTKFPAAVLSVVQGAPEWRSRHEDQTSQDCVQHRGKLFQCKKTLFAASSRLIENSISKHSNSMVLLIQQCYQLSCTSVGFLQQPKPFFAEIGCSKRKSCFWLL